MIMANQNTILFLHSIRTVGLLATVTALAGCFLQDTTIRQTLVDSPKVIKFVQVRDLKTGATSFVPCDQDSSTDKTLEQCSHHASGILTEDVTNVSEIAKTISSKKVQRLNLKEYVTEDPASKTDTKNMTISQEQAQTKAAIVSAQGLSMKMDNIFASAKRIVPFSYSTGGLGPLGKLAVKEMALIAKDADRIYVRGRTDSSGTQAKNILLAKSRADSVRTRFVADGVPRSKVHATYCTTCFIASNATEAGRRLNRRVDVELIMPIAKVGVLPKNQYEIVQLENSLALDLQKDMQIAGQ